MRKDSDAGSEVAKLVGQILANLSSSGSKELEAWSNPERDLRRVAELDYAPSLRALLDRDAIENVVHSARGIFPDLNRQHDPVNLEGWLKGSPLSSIQKLFAQVTDRRDIHLQGTPFTGEGGLALRGFFVDRDGESLKRPLIYVNTAHHPVAVAATLFHEVGHLVASEIFEPRHSPVQFFFDVDYASHLEDLGELTADVVLSLAAYPAPLARKIFGALEKTTADGKTLSFPDRLLPRIVEHYRARFGVSLTAADIPAPRKLNYLGGMIHFAKLRAALLAEYGV
ncbi:MAG TPA: hypothetical protein VKV03_05505 [Candidatus Binataceae bacterium]|nr:hypothetical protein [Candidatus Binataceae bacterium]